MRITKQVYSETALFYNITIVYSRWTNLNKKKKDRFSVASVYMCVDGDGVKSSTSVYISVSRNANFSSLYTYFNVFPHTINSFWALRSVYV